MRDRSWFIRLLGVLALAIVLVPDAAVAQSDDEQPGRIELVIFYGERCPYCARELTFLDDLEVREPLLDVVAYEVWNDEQNRELFRTTAASHGTEPQAVPTTFLGDSVWVGFDSTVQRQIEAAVAALTAGETPSGRWPSRCSGDRR